MPHLGHLSHRILNLAQHDADGFFPALPELAVLGVDWVAEGVAEELTVDELAIQAHEDVEVAIRPTRGLGWPSRSIGGCGGHAEPPPATKLW